jgi:hypothetical protein
MSNEQLQNVSNPFARQRDESLVAGATEIESTRAITEVQSALVIAKKFPRDEAKAYEKVMAACGRLAFAEEALYSFPRSGQAVTGPSIRFAEMIAVCWGNIEFGIRELSRKEGVSEMQAWAWDQQTNVRSVQNFTVRHIRDTKGGGKALTDERDIYELTANQGSRRLRSRILAVIPHDFTEAALKAVQSTLAGNVNEPIADRCRKVVSAFAKLGVPLDLLTKKLGRPLEQALPEDFAELTTIRNSLKDGMSKASDWFAVKEANAAETIDAASKALSKTLD